MSDNPACYFCGKSHDQVRRLIVSNQNPSGQARATCNECVVLHMEILALEDIEVRDQFIALLREIEPLNSDRDAT